jgi:hypothetical protein
LADLVVVDKKIKALTKELKAMVVASGSRLMHLPGVGPVVAARTLADVGHVARFADRNRFASGTGTAPIEASSGEQIRHRLSRAGNRKANHVDPHRRRLSDPPGHPGLGLLPAEARRRQDPNGSDALSRSVAGPRRGWEPPWSMSLRWCGCWPPVTDGAGSPGASYPMPTWMR